MPHSSMPNPPKHLASLQQAFGAAISAPFEFEEDDSGDYRLRQEDYPAEVLAQMVPLPEKGLNGSDRLGTYNRQYWFRLLSVMQEEYPLMVAIMGLLPFNRMVMDYLEAYPPHSPSLRDLSNHLCGFLAESTTWNQAHLQQAAKLEYCFIMAFDAANLPVLDISKLDETGQEALVSEPLRLQPHLQLCHESYNLMHWRSVVKAAPETTEVYLQEDENLWVICRQEGSTTSSALGALQYKLLSHLISGLSLEGAILATCENLNEEEANFVSANIGNWFGHWQSLGWFAA